MLILTRRIGERIIIGENIAVAVLKSNRGHVSIGIDAPDNVPVHREEIYLKNIREGRECRHENSINYN